MFMTQVRIVNVVATASVNQSLNLFELSKFKGIRYNLSTYQGRVAYYKVDKMIGRVSIFPSGKMISVGTKSEADAFSELELTEKFLVEAGLITSVKLKPQTQNLVISANLERIVNLERLAETPKVIYEPEQFPGLIMHLNEPCKASVLIFASGKIVIVGLKNSKQINAVVQKTEEITLFNQ
jgi:TATA-box binding protein (TBP) (component of TFIID and TFIIIB)